VLFNCISRSMSIDKFLDAVVPVAHDFLEARQFAQRVEVGVDTRPPSPDRKV